MTVKNGYFKFEAIGVFKIAKFSQISVLSDIHNYIRSIAG